MNLNSVLHVRNSHNLPGREIYYLEENDPNGSVLNEFIRSLIKKSLDTSVLPYRLGILYQFISGHVSPLLIEYRDDGLDDTESDSCESQSEDGSERDSDESFQSKQLFRIYSTDSRAFDVEAGEELRTVILNLSLHPNVEVYALGLDPTLYEAKMNTIRQHTDTGCAVYSLVDLEILQRVYDLQAYFNPFIEELEDERCFQITQLPPNMMLYSQSIKGNDQDNRRGIKHYIEQNIEQANISFRFLEQTMSMEDIFSVKGYLSLVNSISQIETPGAMIHQAIQQGQGGESLNIGEKKMTLRDLYAWHIRHDQKSFMIDMFSIIYSSFSTNGFNAGMESNPKYEAHAFLDTEIISIHSCNFNEYGPKTNLVPFSPDTSVDDEAPGVTHTVSGEYISDEFIVDSVITLLARTVLSRTPDREFLLNQEESNWFRATPAVSSSKTSPMMEPCQEVPPLMGNSFFSGSLPPVPGFIDPSPNAAKKNPRSNWH
jgi:hypothetical protein